MAHFRSFIFLLGYTLFTTVYGVLSLPLKILPARTQHRIIISWTHIIIFWVRISCGLRYRVIGKENISKVDMPVVILSKHQSAWETFFLQGLFWPASTVLKKELLKIPFFGWGLASLRPIAIDRSNPRSALREVKEQGLKRIEQGNNLLLFPEGTRVPIGQRGKYARSGAEIAKTAGRPILPVSHNAGSCWGIGGSFLKKPGLITVVIGAPISVDEKDTRQLTQEVEDWIESTLEDILAERI